jgi:protein-disulfide isomerase
LTTLIAVAVFAVGAFLYSAYDDNEAATATQSSGVGPDGATSQNIAATQNVAASQNTVTAQGSGPLVRPHSPVLGPRNARVTIVEFFDPSCEACRAFYPVVKQVMAEYPSDVRLVIRYAPLHAGSEEGVRILEAARLQGVYLPVLEALLASQPEWHDGNMAGAWAAAETAGLNVPRARAALRSPQIDAVLQGDIADLQAVGIKGTPTFFVNGKPLSDFGEQQFRNMVRAEVEAGRR